MKNSLREEKKSNQKRQKKYINQLLGARSTQKLVDIHSSSSLKYYQGAKCFAVTWLVIFTKKPICVRLSTFEPLGSFLKEVFSSILNKKYPIKVLDRALIQ